MAEIVIADFATKRFRDRIAALGFERIHELEFGRELDAAGAFRLKLIPPDRPWDDSAILLWDDSTTLLDVNDCHLDETTLRSIVEALASDEMAGRGPATEGDRAARRYLSDFLAGVGAQPGAADGSWEQPLGLISVTATMPASRFAAPSCATSRISMI